MNATWTERLETVLHQLAQHQYPAAWEGLAELERTHPQQPTVYQLQGNVLFITQRYAQALECYFKALALAPDNAHILADTGSTLHMLGRFAPAHTYLRAALTWQLHAPRVIASSTAPPSLPFHDLQAAEQCLWQVLAGLAQAGIHAFATSGVLLGLVRQGGLLPFDKDLDIGIPANEARAAMEWLQQRGWRRTATPKGMTAPIMLHNAQGLALDLCLFRVEANTGQTIGGFWFNGVPEGWQRITCYPMLELHTTASPCGPVWTLREPERWLEALYGPDWRIPDPNFDTIISAHNMRGFSLITQCYALSRLYGHWLNRRYGKALSIARACVRQLPNDFLLQHILAHVQHQVAATPCEVAST